MSVKVPDTMSEIDWAAYFDPDWLALHQEPIIEPDLPIVDPHHHLWPWSNYGVAQYLADLRAGHNVRATVYLESGLAYRETGPEHLRTVGEIEYVLSLLADPLLAEPGAPNMCAGIIGAVNFDDPPERVDEALAAQAAAAKGRFKGVRLNAMWDPDFGWADVGPERLGSATMRQGFAMMQRHDLVCDLMVFHPQLPQVPDFANAFPGTTIVLNHLGGVSELGARAGRHEEVLAEWKAGIGALVACPNIMVKLGGLNNGHFSGWRFNEDPLPPSSQVLADAYRPYVEFAIERFGPERCMFESNYPADKSHCSYPVLWNAFKRLAGSCSADEKQALFSGTAARVYTLRDI